MNGQWVLTYPGTEYAFGTPATPTFNRTTPEVGGADIRSSDFDRPRSDGRAFGIDFRAAQTISFDLGIRGGTEAEVRAEAEKLAQAWRADAVRLTPGAVAELRTQYAGRERVVYGRPRRFAPIFSDVAVNRFVTATATFAAMDDVFYGGSEESVEFSIVPPQVGGLIAPLAAPLSTTRTADRSQGIRIETELPVWPVLEISGPITNPVVTIGEGVRFEARVTLLHDETLTIDTRPWARSAMRNGTANVAGSIRGTRLSRAALPAGAYEVGLSGIDPTGTAAVRLAWRAAYSSL